MSYSLILAWIMDQLLGDPAALPHPVVYMGRWIAYWEHRLNNGAHRLRKGALMAVGSILLIFLLSGAVFWSLSSLSSHYHSFLNTGWLGYVCDGVYFFLSVIFIFFCLAGCTLRREVRMVFEAVDRGLDEGRRQVARIVGRDTQQLSAQEVRTAALETLAENLSDGVVAPLFWFVLLGVPGMLTYKMINTLDSMIGYHSPRYKEFGCWAARIDDVANYVPARLTALLMVLAGWLLSLVKPGRVYGGKRLSLGRLLRFTLHYGPQHASPNSGWPEAALAGILQCQFGGSHNYFGEIFHKPHIGNNPRPLTTSDMRTSLLITFLAECAALLIALLTECAAVLITFFISF